MPTLTSRVRNLASIAAGIAAVSVVVAVPHAAQAQISATISGRVSDAKTGKPIADALVIVTGNSIQGEQNISTDASGFYRLPNLPAGIYNLQVLAGGFGEYTSPKITLRSGQTVQVRPRLVRVGDESIKVVVEAPTVDITSAQNTTSVGQEFIKRVPLVAPGAQGGLQRSFESVAAVAPGAVVDSAGTSLGGASSPENSYRIDNMSVGSPVDGTLSSSLSSEFADEVQVVDAGYLPEYGRSAAGAISATLKSGGNELHGGAWAFISPGALAKSGTINPLSNNSIAMQEKPRYKGDIGFDVGGKIIKDKLWFYAGAQVAQNSVENVRHFYAWDQGPDKKPSEISNLRDSFKTRSTLASAVAKLTYALNEDNKFSVVGMYLPSFNGARSGKFLREDAEGNGNATQRRGVEQNHVVDVAVRWQGTRLNKMLTHDTQVQWHHESYYNGPNDKKGHDSNSDEGRLPQVQWSDNGVRSLSEFIRLSGRAAELCTPTAEVPNPCPVTQYVTGGMGEIMTNAIQRVQARHATGYSFEWLGRHTAKAGIDLEYLTSDRTKSKSGNMLLQEQSDGWTEFERVGVVYQPDKIAYINRFTAQAASAIWGGFIQDQWTIADQFTINAGLRYDGQSVSANHQVWVALPWQFGPRVGLVWDPTKKGKAKIFANYSRTFQAFPLEMALTNGGGEAKAQGAPNGDLCMPNGDTIGKACTDFANWLQNNTLLPNRHYQQGNAIPAAVDPKLRPTTNDEVIAGAQWEFIPSHSISLTYRMRRLSHVVEDISRTETASYFLANPGYGSAKDFPKASRSYDAVVLGFNRAMTNHWMVMASYTLSWLRGNYEGFISGEDILPGITSSFDLKSLLTNAYGYLPGDRRHQLKLYFAGELPMGSRLALNGGAAFVAMSGGPTSYRGYHYLYGESSSFLLPRGTYHRLPWTTSLDLSASFSANISKDLRVALEVQVFNVLNITAPTSIDENYSFGAELLPVVKGGATAKDLKKALDASGAEKNSAFGTVQDRQSPISGRAGIRVSF